MATDGAGPDGSGLSEWLGGDEMPPPAATAEEMLAFYDKAYPKLMKKIGQLGGVHAHMKKCLDAAQVPGAPAIHRRVELACLELQQVKLSEKSLRVQLNARDEFDA